jgi:hypothetical protein
MATNTGVRDMAYPATTSLFGNSAADSATSYDSSQATRGDGFGDCDSHHPESVRNPKLVQPPRIAVSGRQELLSAICEAFLDDGIRAHQLAMWMAAVSKLKSRLSDRDLDAILHEAAAQYRSAPANEGHQSE